MLKIRANKDRKEKYVNPEEYPLSRFKSQSSIFTDKITLLPSQELLRKLLALLQS